MSVIDIHAHYVPQGWEDLGKATGDHSRPWPWLRVDSEKQAMMMVGDTEFRPITDNSWNASVRLEEMDADGVDIQVLSPTPVFFTYEESGKTSATIARIFNDLALEIADEGEGRLLPFCQVPLQDTEEAIKELDRCIANGHRGVEIGNHVGDRDLDDAGIVEFLAHAASLDVPVFVHPWDMAESPRLNRWMARWLAGMPQETHLSIISMILGGAFDKLPKNLKLCFAHSGGSFPYWLGRFENAWHRRPDLIATSELPPSHYIDRFSVDTVVFQEASLRLLVDVMGAERIMLGSDYPYPLGETPVGTVVKNASFLSDEQEAMILGGNAQRFLGL
ncbi:MULTISPECIES: amidohydrolase family protein [Rothia]|uniref:amidohydrolase family protein n=1 Tax=Rothia TaxID=32207 RepID=UPI001EEFF643|nr:MULTISPECIES: amidohydrolase family protein [Rothia]